VSPFGEFIPLRREGFRGRIFQKKKYNKLNMTSSCTSSERGITSSLTDRHFEIF
jgi:hypothetical protein